MIKKIEKIIEATKNGLFNIDSNATEKTIVANGNTKNNKIGSIKNTSYNIL